MLTVTEDVSKASRFWLKDPAKLAMNILLQSKAG